ncbi:hypothetical protein SAMN05443377_13611 [Propionibacterium cyclohexanicum]|uniref:Uncharacterized protein n=1 Tax=Propionibacterium cyclohexanicum TaxID=64702 RepID=A0A1H9U275_9ACTN|nr:hypothetical protein [Propionibacterium cyclohexanicum]SES03595.1 hypothetical protein SAMN05443377_13611 [Propionibacterium cyclohexanicum]
MSKNDGVAGPGGPIARLDGAPLTALGITSVVIFFIALVVISLIFGQ